MVIQMILSWYDLIVTMRRWISAYSYIQKDNLFYVKIFCACTQLLIFKIKIVIRTQSLNFPVFMQFYQTRCLFFHYFQKSESLVLLNLLLYKFYLPRLSLSSFLQMSPADAIFPYKVNDLHFYKQILMFIWHLFMQGHLLFSQISCFLVSHFTYRNKNKIY